MITRLQVFVALSVSAFLLIVATSAGYIYSIHFEQPYLSYKNLPFPITQTAYPGDRVALQIIRCNSANEPKTFTSTRMMLPEDKAMQVRFFQDFEVTVKPGCTPVTQRLDIVPMGVPPGYYRYVGAATVRGLFGTHEVKWHTDIIEVLARPDSKTNSKPVGQSVVTAKKE